MKVLSPTDMVVDILKEHGNWVESPHLLREVKKKREVSDRQVFRYLEKALEEGKIRKVKLSENEVLYGLTDWAFPEVSSKKKEETLTLEDAFKYQCFKKLEEIGRISDEGNPILALNRLSRLVNMLPSQQKEKLSPRVRQSYDLLGKVKGIDYYTRLRAKLDRAYVLVELLIERISTVLHES